MEAVMKDQNNGLPATLQPNFDVAFSQGFEYTTVSSFNGDFVKCGMSRKVLDPG